MQAEPFADHRRDERQRQHGGGEHGCEFAAGLVALAVGGRGVVNVIGAADASGGTIKVAS